MGEVSILDILKILLKRIWAIIIAAVLCGSVALVYCRVFATPKYQSKSSVIASNGNIATEGLSNGTITGESVQSNDLSASLSLTSTFEVLLKNMPAESEDFVTMLKEKGVFDAYQSSSVSIAAREDTLVIDITVTSTDRNASIEIANIYAECSEDFVEDTYKLGIVKPCLTARSSSQVFPRPFMTTALAAILGAAILSFILVAFELSDRTINGEDDLKAHYDIPILGSVPDFQTTVKGGKK